jgi:hypothetical protein
MDQQLVLFDYNTLDTETRIVVQQRTTEIKALMRKTAQDIVEIGQKLDEVRAKLNNGKFSEWLEKEFNWSRRTAYRFISVYEQFGRANLAQLDIAPSALYLLAEPSTPDAARQEGMARAEAGETISLSRAQVIVDEHKEDEQEPEIVQPEIEMEGETLTPVKTPSEGEGEVVAAITELLEEDGYEVEKPAKKPAKPTPSPRPSPTGRGSTQTSAPAKDITPTLSNGERGEQLSDDACPKCKVRPSLYGFDRKRNSYKCGTCGTLVDLVVTRSKKAKASDEGQVCPACGKQVDGSMCVNCGEVIRG